MADSKESFEILENGSGDGVAATSSQIGEASGGKIGMTVFPFRDASGNLRMPEVNVSNVLKTDGSAVTQPVSAASLPLPAGAATSANQLPDNHQVTVSNASIAVTGPLTDAQLRATAVPIDQTQVGGTAVATGNGVAGAGSQRVVIASDNTAFSVNAIQSGSWNVGNVTGTVSLPTGASTSALQTSGNASLTSIDGKTPALGQALMAASVPVVIASNQTAVPITYAPQSSGATSPDNSTSVALVASQVVKASPGVLYVVTGYNNRATAQFIQMYNATSLPANGAVPVIVITVPGRSNFSYDVSPYGRFFSTGIVIGNSSTAATKTIGASDCWFDVQYK